MFKRLFGPLFVAVALLVSLFVLVPASPAAAGDAPSYSIYHNKSQVKAKAGHYGWSASACAIGGGVSGGAGAVATKLAEGTVKKIGIAGLVVGVACVLDHFFVQGSSAAKIYTSAATLDMCVRTDVWLHNSQYSWGKSTVKYEAYNC